MNYKFLEFISERVYYLKTGKKLRASMLNIVKKSHCTFKKISIHTLYCVVKNVKF